MSAFYAAGSEIRSARTSARDGCLLHHPPSGRSVVTPARWAWQSFQSTSKSVTMAVELLADAIKQRSDWPDGNWVCSRTARKSFTTPYQRRSLVGQKGVTGDESLGMRRKPQSAPGSLDTRRSALPKANLRWKGCEV